MKPLHIDMTPPRSWKTVWLLALLAVALAAACALSQHLHLADQLRAQDQAIEATQTRLARLRDPAPQIVDPRAASLSRAHNALHADLNKALAAAENLNLPGVLLTSLQIEPTSDLLRLEFSLDNLAKADQITAFLGSGYDKNPWNLNSLVSTATPNGAPSASPAPLAKGVWTAHLSHL